MLARRIAISVVVACLGPAVFAQNSEARAARAFEQARKQGPVALYAFLHDMPKGADLHYHLAGAVYAETFIREAIDDHLCVNSRTITLYKGEPTCGAEGKPVSNALDDQKLYDQLINVFSMRTFVPTTEESGHDHFFDSFQHFFAVEDARFVPEWVDEAASRAAVQNEQYLEIMHTPSLAAIPAALFAAAGPIDNQTDFAAVRQKVLDAGLASAIPALRSDFDNAEHGRREREHCDAASPMPACAVEVRFLYQVLRALTPQQVFVQLLCGFEVASADPLVVGINMVQPEDGRVAMENYAMQMRMVHALHQLYPKVHITLHAGELSPSMVTPEGVRFHIRSAVEEADAERIGHGVDVMYEDHPYELLKEMAAKKVMVEINLTSNDVILNIKGADHPFPLYRLYHVPVALSTDDEGVSRINLTHEYVRAAMTYPLTYGDLKEMVRTGIEHSFLPAPERAKQQAELTRRFAQFEKTF